MSISETCFFETDSALRRIYEQITSFHLDCVDPRNEQGILVNVNERIALKVKHRIFRALVILNHRIHSNPQLDDLSGSDCSENTTDDCGYVGKCCKKTTTSKSFHKRKK